MKASTWNASTLTGTARFAKPVAVLMTDLGVQPSHSRPRVSSDNPLAEAQFKTMKYQPDYPERFGSLADARTWAQVFFPWYNTEHHHSGIGFMAPATVHSSEAARLFTERQQTLNAAYAIHPESFVKGPPTPPALPITVWINPPPATAQPADVVVPAVDPLGNSEHSRELSTSPQPSAQKGAASHEPDRVLRF